MAGASQKKNFSRSKSGGEHSLKGCQVLKPPPFRFGKVAYAEAKVASIDKKKVSANACKSNATSIFQISSKPNDQLNRKPISLQESFDMKIGLHRRKDSKTAPVSCNPFSRARLDARKGACQRVHPSDPNVCSDMMLNAKTATKIDIAASANKELKNGFEKELQEAQTTGCWVRAESKDDALSNRVAHDATSPCVVGDNSRNIQSWVADTKGTLEDKDVNERTRDATKQDRGMGSKGKKDARVDAKRSSGSTLVKQKSKRIPTRHIKYVSELDEKVRNKYRRNQDCAKKKGRGKENNPSVNLKDNDIATIGNVTGTNDSGAARLRNGTCSNERDKKDEESIIAKKEKVEKMAKGSKGARVSSAPVSKIGSRNVESFLVRNGLIPKAASKTQDVKGERTLIRKKSVRLIVTRSKSRSMRKLSSVNIAAKQVKKEEASIPASGRSFGIAFKGPPKVCDCT